jgi:hypothetical protein
MAEGLVHVDDDAPGIGDDNAFAGLREHAGGELQAGFRLLALGNVDAGADQDRAALEFDAPAGEIEGRATPVQADQAALGLGAAFGEAAGDGGDNLRPLVLVEQRNRVGCHQLRSGSLGDGQQVVVEQQEAAAGIDGVEHAGNGFDQGFAEGALRRGFKLRPFAFGDVLDGAQHAGRAPVCSELDHRGDITGDFLAAMLDDAALERIGGLLEQRRLDLAVEALPVAGMHLREEQFVARRQGAGLETEQAEGFVIPGQRTGCGVPVPGTHLADGGGEIVALLGFAQLVLGRLARGDVVHHGEGADDATAGVAQRRGVEQAGQRGAGAVGQFDFVAGATSGFLGDRGAFAEDSRVPVIDEGIDRTTLDFRLAHRQHRAQGAIGA